MATIAPGALVLVVAVSLACGAGQATFEALPASTPVPASPVPASTTSAADRASRAEALYLPRLEPALAESIRSQPWFDAMTAEHLSLIGTILETERAAGARGEKASVAAAFRFATEQPWYADGFDATEALGLHGVFQTYGVSLSDRRAPQVGPALASTIEHQLMRGVELPETGTIVVLVSTDDAALGRRALDLAVHWLPRVESITGAFPILLPPHLYRGPARTLHGAFEPRVYPPRYCSRHR